MIASKRIVVGIVLAVTSFGAATGHAFPDVSGRWHIDGTLGIQPFTQRGNSLDMAGGHQVDGWSGVIADDGWFTLEGPPIASLCVTYLDGRFLPGATTLVGGISSYCADVRRPSVSPPLTGRRCTCFDGNTTAGDGCDEQCQVEPCFVCTGDPSVCTPLADGDACDDGSACTTGETCNGGTCAGGAGVAACLDLTGRWDTETTTARSAPYTLTFDVTQDDDLVTFSSAGGAFQLGMVDPSTRTLTLHRGGTFDFSERTGCLGEATGTISPDGDSFHVTGAMPILTGYDGFMCRTVPVAIAGQRRTTCGNGVLDARESCDDGNTTAGDGCSERCIVEACWQCTGAPSVCAAPPRTSCNGSTAPERSALRIRRGRLPAQDTIRWGWAFGSPTTAAELGNPLTTTDYALCVFDESGLRFRATAPAGGTCGTRACWKDRGASGLRYDDPEQTPDGLRTLLLKTGAAGKAKVKLLGRGALLSGRPYGIEALPLPVPMTVQLQGTDGACFEARYEAADVTSDGAP